MPQEIKQDVNHNEKMGSKESARHIESVINGLKILDLFIVKDQLRLKDITELTGLGKSRVIRLCGTLIHMGYLRYNKSTLLYTLGHKPNLLGKAYKKSNPLESIARPILQNLSAETKETCSLFVVDGVKNLCLARVEGSESIRFTISEGTRRELYQGASGKALLAYADNELKEQVLAFAHEDFARGVSKKDVEQILEELEEVRNQGYAFSESEITPGLSAFGAPIIDYNGEICASMSVTCPTFRFTPERKELLLIKLLASVQECSQALGFNNMDTATQ